MRLLPSFLTALFKKQNKPILERLEDIEDEILGLETTRSSSLDSEKRFVFRLVVYSLIFYGLGFMIFYYYLWPTTQRGKLLMYTSLAIYPFVISFLRWIFRSYFVRRISRTDNRLKILRESKQQLLEEVMEKETFKKAQQILKRFDPLMFASLSSLDNLVTETPRTTSKAPLLHGSEMNLRSRKGFADGDNQSFISFTPLRRMTLNGKSNSVVPNAETNPPTNLGQPQIKNIEEPPKPRLLRPILPRERSVVDRLIDALVGDGPDRRFALICQECASHNGMALQEEFEYLAFRCCYCSHFNPPRRSLRPPPVPSNIAQSVSTMASSSDQPQREQDDFSDRVSDESEIKRRITDVSEPDCPTPLRTNGDNPVEEEHEEIDGDVTLNGDADHF